MGVTIFYNSEIMISLITVIREIMISLLQKIRTSIFDPKSVFSVDFRKGFRCPIDFGFFYRSRIHLQIGEKSAEHDFEKFKNV